MSIRAPRLRALGATSPGNAWRYDPEADEWTVAGNLPTPRHGLGAATVGDVIYTFGGGTEVGGNFASARNEAFTPE